MVKQKTIKNSNQKMISTKLRIAILQDEIALWEKRCDTEPRSNLYYGYIRDMMTNRVKELKDIENIGMIKMIEWCRKWQEIGVITNYITWDSMKHV